MTVAVDQPKDTGPVDEGKDELYDRIRLLVGTVVFVEMDTGKQVREWCENVSIEL